MIDNIRLYFNDRDKILRHIEASKEFKGTYDSASNTIIYPYKFKIGTLCLIITQTHAYLENSIHKYSNFIETGTAHNTNDFEFENLCNTLLALEKTLNYDLNDTLLTSLEFGYNLPIKRNPSDIIDNNILLHKFKPPTQYESNSIICLKRFKTGNYKIKIYDKSKMCGLPSHLLRLEIVYKKLELKKLNIESAKDLICSSKIEALHNDFMSKFDNLLIVDSRFSHLVTQTEQEYIGNLLEYTYWRRPFPNIKAKTREKDKFRTFIAQKNLLTTKESLRVQLNIKFQKCFKMSKKQLV